MTSSLIHPTAIIGSDVTLGNNVRIGPYCVVEGNVTIGDDTVLHAHVAVSATGQTTIGAGCEIFPFASLGHKPQDLKYQGEATTLHIGAGCTIREHVTINPGTATGGGVTQVGERCLLMVGAHVAHDCKVGNEVILANNATLAGHVEVDDYVIIGGLAAVHQFVRVGRHAVIGGMSGVEHDVIPFGSVMGERGSLAGLNLIGLKRRGFSRESIHSLRGAYKQLFAATEHTLDARSAKVAQDYAQQPEVEEIIAFIRHAGKRSLCVPKTARYDVEKDDA